MNSPSDIVWLELSAIYAIHEVQLAEHGGSIGVREPGLLESALHRPKQHAAYADDAVDIPKRAALYAIAFCRDHPFIDGNKLVALVALELFMRRNGFRLVAGNAACVVQILGLASGERTDDEFIDWVRAHASR